MRRPEVWNRLPSPILTATVLALVLIVVLFWGRANRIASAPSVAQIALTHAKLSDGDCEFAADVHLANRLSGFAFSMRESAVRTALIELLRSKSRYMVGTATAREALRYQMLSAVNRVIGAGRATAIDFTEFELL